ncbi:hypothetical protein ACHAPE_008148 [Trichoderma viride]
MENPSTPDAPPPAGLGAQQPFVQLPPQMFTTAAQLLDLTDSTGPGKKLMVVLRDGRKLIGVLRSWDQFANIVLQQTTERIFAPRADNHDAQQPYGYFADIPQGIFLVRGENVLLLGEIDSNKDDDAPPGYELAEVDVVKKLAEAKKAADKAKEKARLKKLVKIGFEGENLGDIFF